MRKVILLLMLWSVIGLIWIPGAGANEIALVEEANEENSLVIDGVHIVAELDQAGHLHVQQQMVYSFMGAHNGILWTIGTRGSDGVEGLEAYALPLEDLEVYALPLADTGETLQNDLAEFFLAESLLADTLEDQSALQNNDTGLIPLFIEQEEDGSQVDLRIHHQVENEAVLFQLNYVLKNVVHVYEDIADLEWSFIDGRNQLDFAFFQMAVGIPEPFSEEEIYIYPRLPEGHQLQIVDQQIIFSIEPLSAREEAGFRILFPTQLVADMEEVSPVERKAELMMKEEEGEFAYWTRFLYSESRAGMVLELILIVFLVPVIVLILVWRLINHHYYGHYPEPFRGETYPQIPQNISPAVAAMFMQRMDSDRQLMATLLDLARKGFVRVEKEQSVSEQEVGNQHKKKETEEQIIFVRVAELPREKEPLTTHEQFVLEWLFEEVGTDGILDADMMKQFAQDHPEEFEKQWSTWQTHVKAELEQLNYRQKNAGALWFLLVGMLPIVGGIVGMVMLEAIHFIALLVVGVGMMTYAFFYDGLTEEGYIQWGKWKGYIKYLKDIQRASAGLSVHDQPWDRHLMYAIVFGLSDQLIIQLGDTFTELQDSHPFLFACQAQYMVILYSSIQHSSSSSQFSSTSSTTGGGGSRGSF